MTDTREMGTKDGTSVVTPTALKEAVEREVLPTALRHVANTWPELKVLGSVARQAADEIERLKTTLSSQAESLEAMASALSDLVEAIDQGQDIDPINSDYFHAARTTLTQYRKTGDL